MPNQVDNQLIPIVPKVTTGRTLFLGGTPAALVINTGDKSYLRLNRLALFLSRLCNRTSESHFYLDIEPDLVGKLNNVFIQDKHLGKIGFITDHLVISSATDSPPMASHQIQRRKIPDEFLKKGRDGNRDTVAVIAVGATNLRFALVKEGNAIEERIITTKFTNMDDIELQKMFRLASLINEEKTLISGTLAKLNKAAINGQIPEFTADEERILQTIQLSRIKNGLDELFEKLTVLGINGNTIKGIVFSAPGNSDLASGIIDSEGLIGIHNLNLPATIEVHYQLPVVVQNDVDSEITALVDDIDRVNKLMITNQPITFDYDELIKSILGTLNNVGDTKIIVGYGGGTGIGGAHLILTRTEHNTIKTTFLTGRTTSAGDFGHDRLDNGIHEFDCIVTKAKEQASRDGLGDGFINLLVKQVKENPANMCLWCGNNIEFGSMAGGIFFDRQSAWILDYLKKNDTSAYQQLRQIIVDNHPEYELTMQTDDALVAKAANTGDFIDLYLDHQNVLAKTLLNFQARVWAAHFVITHNDGKQIVVDGLPLQLDTFFIAHKMFSGTNRFFVEMVVDSLKNDFTNELGNSVNYYDYFTLLFRHDTQNQAIGAASYLEMSLEDSN